MTDLFTSTHLEKAAEFYINSGINDEYVPHLARVCLRAAHISFMAGDNAYSSAGLERANEHLDKVSPKHRWRQEEAIFDAEVVIWAR